MSEKKKQMQEEPLEALVGPQLGSNPTSMIKGEYDMMRLGIINQEEPHAMAYFLNHPNKRRQNWWTKTIHSRLDLSPSVEGLGRKQLIQAIAASKGITQKNEAKQPGIIGRLLTQRDWKEKAVMQGKEIPEE